MYLMPTKPEEHGTLRVVTWNMHFANRQTAAAIAALRKLNADVICLQEVPAESIEALRVGLGLPYIAIGDDYLHTGIDTHVVTLSRYPFATQMALTNPSQRTRFHRWFGGREGQQAVATTLHVYGREVRILNVHLPLHVPPSRRLAIVEGYLASAEKPDLFCGDFNSCGRPWLAPFLGAFHNYRAVDFRCHEQKRLVRLMQRYGFVNPFKRRTHAQMPFQLDGIYAAQGSFLHWQGERLRSRLGSDHWPLLLTTTLRAQLNETAA